MGYKFNVFTGNLDIVNNASGGSVTASDVSVADSENVFNSDNVEDALYEINTKMDKNGFDRYKPETMPDVPLFDPATRIVSIRVKSGSPNFSFYANNKLYTKTTTQTTTLPNVSGSYYIYFDNDGNIQNELQTGLPDEAFYSNAIATFVYFNKDYPTEYLMNWDEYHGKDMSGITHQSKHSTDGAKYSSGLEVQGIVENDTTYTQTTSGVIFDEDIKHIISSNATGHSTFYRYGAEGNWRKLSPDLSVAHKEGGDSYYSYNKFDGTNYGWKEGGSTDDFWIQFFISHPGGISKIPGQNGYSSVRKARNAIETEVTRMNTEGLPNPEFIWLGCCIVKRTGEVKEMADGNVWYSLLQGSRGVGTGSGTTTYAADVPTNTTEFKSILSDADTDVQNALNTLDSEIKRYNLLNLWGKNDKWKETRSRNNDFN